MSLFKAYVLYLFLSLMLSYLECEINDTEVVAYLESQPPQYLPCPFNYCFPGEIPRGREFLRYCKFGTLQVIFTIFTSSNPHFHHSYFSLTSVLRHQTSDSDHRDDIR